MHTTSFNGTTFTYNSDLSGPVIIVSKSHSVETNYESLRQYVAYQEKEKQLQALEQANLEQKPPTLKYQQRLIIGIDYEAFMEDVNKYLGNGTGWRTIPSTLKLIGLESPTDDYQMRYAIILEREIE